MNIKIVGLPWLIENIDHVKRMQYNVISIRDYISSPEYDIIDNAGLENLLAIRFDDDVPTIAGRYQGPIEQDIEQIIEWSKKKMQENNNDFIVQCTAGVSRSSSVAILVNYLQNPENPLDVINPLLHSPNEHVLELGDKYFNDKIKEKTQELLKKHDEEFKKRFEE